MTPPHPTPKAGDAAPSDEGTAVLTLIKRIQSGETAPGSLSVDQRRACVEHLAVEGYSVAEMAVILKVTDRTVQRDRQAIRAANALERDPSLLPQEVGRLSHVAEVAIQRIRRTSRDKDAPHSARIDGEHRCYQIYSDYIKRLQSLGYLPTATQRIEEDLTHHDGDAPDLSMILGEVKRLMGIAEGGEHEQTFKQLEQMATQIALANQVVETGRLIEGDSDVT